jgi:hypothetical protein
MRDVDPTLPSNAGLRMNGVIPLLTLRLQGMVRDNFTFLYIQMFLTAVGIYISLKNVATQKKIHNTTYSKRAGYCTSKVLDLYYGAVQFETW